MPSYLLLSSLLLPVHALGSETKVLFLGDSLTEGYGVTKEEAFPNQVQQLLAAKGKNIKAINAGISGSTSASALSRLKWYLRAKPQVMVLALGANDGLRGLPLKDLESNLDKTITLAKSKGIKVILGGMKIPKNMGTKYFGDFEAIFPRLAKKHELPLIPFLLKGVAARPHLNIADQIHPNAKGHKIIAQTVLKALEAHL